VGSIDSITVNQPQFFEALNSLLGETSLDDWKDYLRFWLVKTHAPFLDDATFGEFFAFKSAFTGQQQPPPRWWRVVWQARNWLGLPLGSLFDEQYWPRSSLARHQALGESLRQAFIERVEGSNWLSASTRDNAIRKLTRLKLTIGPVQQSVDFGTMDLRRDSYVMNMIRSAEWFHEVDLRRLHTPVDQDATEMHPTAGGGDAEYVDSRNEVRLTRPTTVPGWRDDELDDAFVYGSTRLGHEIAHALDSDGRRYDADGNRVDWWRAEDAAAFERRAQALIDQYSSITPLEGLPIDGRRSLRENLADLVGLRLALDAFQKTDQFKRNERVGGVAPLQRFFLAYAYSHMGHERREALATRLRNRAAYAPNRERVNEVVRNVPEFYGAFDVKPGQRMYRPEHMRAHIW
jgi:putative endopeptidase